MTRPRSALVGLLIAAPFYWLLIDTTSSPELIAGAVAAVIAAVAYRAAYLETTANAAIKLRWLSLALVEIARVPRGVVIVCVEVIKQTVAPRPRRGVVDAEPFDTGGSDETGALGRRALTEAFRSFAPDTIVIGTDPDNDRLLIERLGSRQ